MAEVSASFSPVRMRGSSEESAIAQALMIVGVTRDQVQIEIVEQNDKGVTVRVSPLSQTAPTTPAEPETQAEIAIEDAPPANTSSDYANSSMGLEIEPQAEEVAVETEVEVPQLQAAAEAAEELMPRMEAATQIDAPEAPDEAARETSRGMAQEMLDRMGLTAQVTIAPGPFSPLEAGDAEADTRIYLQIDGEDVGILIGKHGATLQSFQYLLNLSLNNHPDEASQETSAPVLRVVLDAGGYRLRRSEALEKSAQEGAERAKRDRRSVRLEPMPAHERRLVHMALRNDTTVQTGSEGREPLRHVVIFPAGSRPERSNDRNDRPNRGPNERGMGGYNANRGGGNNGGYRGGRNRFDR